MKHQSSSTAALATGRSVSSDNSARKGTIVQQRRTEVFGIRMTKDERERLAAMAAAEGIEMGALARRRIFMGRKKARSGAEVTNSQRQAHRLAVYAAQVMHDLALRCSAQITSPLAATELTAKLRAVCRLIDDVVAGRVVIAISQATDATGGACGMEDRNP